MTSLPATVTAGPSDLPPNTCALPRTGQLAGLLTAIRDKQTARGDFIFYSDRIIRLLVEEGASKALSPRPQTKRRTLAGGDLVADQSSPSLQTGLNHLPVVEKSTNRCTFTM